MRLLTSLHRQATDGDPPILAQVIWRLALSAQWLSHTFKNSLQICEGRVDQFLIQVKFPSA
jgi:hypothetical protein